VIVGFTAMLVLPFACAYAGAHIGAFLVSSPAGAQCAFGDNLFAGLFAAIGGIFFGFLVGCGLGGATFAAILGKVG